MKNLVFSLIIIILCFCLVGCSGDNKEQPEQIVIDESMSLDEALNSMKNTSSLMCDEYITVEGTTYLERRYRYEINKESCEVYNSDGMLISYLASIYEDGKLYHISKDYIYGGKSCEYSLENYHQNNILYMIHRIERIMSIWGTPDKYVISSNQFSCEKPAIWKMIVYNFNKTSIAFDPEFVFYRYIATKAIPIV